MNTMTERPASLAAAHGSPFSPPDMDWTSGAACGHGALAAALGITVKESRRYLPKPGWVNVPMMKSAIEVAGYKWVRVEKPATSTTAVILLQFLGPWMRSPIAACQHRHWVATKQGMVWDANTKRWETQAEWSRIVPDLLPDNSTGFSVWGALVIINRPSKCEIRKGIGPCDCCGEEKWPQEYAGYGAMLCADCIDHKRHSANDRTELPPPDTTVASKKNVQ